MKQPSHSDSEVTGRIDSIPKPIAVPSVVSTGKSKSGQAPNIPTAVERNSDNTEKGISVQTADEPSSSPDSQTGQIDASERRPSSVPVQEVSSRVADPDDADRPSGSISTQNPPSQGTSSQSSSINFGNSFDIDPMTQKSIDLRKEQIQRVKKREIDKKRKRIIRIVRRIAILVIVVLVVAVLGTFSIYRWGVNDDYSDMQGTWQIDGTKTKIKIDEEKIKLNKEVSYEYAVDSVSKTLAFDFGQLSGSGRYRFSVDRNHLSLLDGDFDFGETLSDDIPWTFQAFWDFIATSEITSPDLGEGSLTLTRVSEE